MAEPFVNERLFSQLEVSGGRRQFVLTGEIEDYFVVDLYHGAQGLDRALEVFALRQGFEVVILLDAQVQPKFLKPEMEAIFDQTVRGVSDDPRRPAEAKRRVFAPRSQRAADGEPAGPSPAPAQPGPPRQEARQQAVDQVTGAAASAAQTALDQITRMLDSKRKTLVIVKHPERIVGLQPTQDDLRRLETIIGWCRLREGHRENCSILIVSQNRVEQFNTLANLCMDRANFTREIHLGTPNRRELGCFLKRVLGRHGLDGSAKRLAATAHAKQLTLYNFAFLISDHLSQNRGMRTLEGLFADGDQAKTLDELLEELEELVGLAAVKQKVHELINIARDEKARRKSGEDVEPMSYHMFFLGNPGTGKTVVARLLGQIFWALGLRSSSAFVEVSVQDILSAYNEGDTLQNMRNVIEEAMGGVLFIDEVYLFAENDWGKKALEVLMKDMEDRRDDLTVIMAGYAEKMPELFKVNAGFKSRVRHTLTFPDYTAAELVEMFEMRVRKAGLALTADGRQKVTRYIESFARRGGIGNGRGVRNLIEQTRTALAQVRPPSREIAAELIPDPICFREAEARRVLEEIDRDFVGLRRVKEFFKRIFIRQKGIEAKGGDSEAFNHCLFMGNPGTGKTTVARKMGELFYYMGLISEKDKLVEVNPTSDLQSPYQSEFAQKTRDCFDRAAGGVLFIDEAYQLAKDEQGRRVADQIVNLVTDPRYRNLVIIMAGYGDEMRELYKVNAGLKRRFPNEVYFDNFTPDELVTIFHQCVQRDGHHVAPDERQPFDVQVKSALAKLSRQREFGNAGAVKGFYENTVKVNQEMRVLQDETADKFEIRLRDLSGGETRVETVDQILEELDEKFIGLRPVKDFISRLAIRIQIDMERGGARELQASRYNMRFVGNPGTGKTTIARYMSRIFFSLGIISHPESVIECRGVDLKGSYIGHTKDKVNRLFENASGRVVLIDEIYGLYDPAVGQVDSFGQEAIDTLVGAITDPANEDVLMVLAGYKDKLDTFLTANAGLASRFPIEIEFPDYAAAECIEIFFAMLRREGYVCDEGKEISGILREVFARAKRVRGFGNARTVGSIVERVKDNQAIRLHGLKERSPDDLNRIVAEDIRQVLPE